MSSKASRKHLLEGLGGFLGSQNRVCYLCCYQKPRCFDALGRPKNKVFDGKQDPGTPKTLKNKGLQGFKKPGF